MTALYEQRPVDTLGVWYRPGYCIKLYSIRHDDQPLDKDTFDTGWDLVSELLPADLDHTAFGFAVFHQGHTGDSILISWWDGANELQVRRLVRRGDYWLPSEKGESLDLWNIGVLCWEKSAFLASHSAPSEGFADVYLSKQLIGWV